MAYNAALNTIYNHYLTTYAPVGTTPYDTHKKSELRNIYNSIVKLNKESPLYLLNDDKKSQEFAVNIKENARQLRNTIASLGGLGEEEMLGKKVAFTSDKNIVSASFIGESHDTEEVPSFDISVRSLASGQINQGEYLPSAAKALLPPDSYSFDINITDLNYEFQFNIHEDDTNNDIQNRLARLFSNANIGISADVVSDGQGNSALRLASSTAGLPQDRETLFHITDDRTSKTAGAVAYFGLDHVEQQASKAEFLLNGDYHTATSNHFTVSKMYELTLNGISENDDSTVHISLKNDTESLNENINSLIEGYNSFVSSSAGHLEEHPLSNRLVNQIKGIANYYKDTLSNVGLSVQQDGSILLDDDQFQNVIDSGEDLDKLSPLKDFTNAILRKSNQISLNPMEYVDKKIVSYKNPGHNFATPYITSAYSGMMFNDYC